MAFRLHRLGFMEATSLSELAAGAYGEAIDLQVTNLTGFVDGVLKAVKGIHGDRGLNVGGTADRLFDLGLQNHKKLSTMAERGRKGLDAALGALGQPRPARRRSRRRWRSGWRPGGR